MSSSALAGQVATIATVASWISVLSLNLRFQLATPESESTVLILRCEEIEQVIILFLLTLDLERRWVEHVMRIALPPAGWRTSMDWA
jgi:hypothetical protein